MNVEDAIRELTDTWGRRGLARRLGVDPITLWRWREANQLPGVKEYEYSKEIAAKLAEWTGEPEEDFLT